MWREPGTRRPAGLTLKVGAARLPARPIRDVQHKGINGRDSAHTDTSMRAIRQGQSPGGCGAGRDVETAFRGEARKTEIWDR